MKQRSKQRFAFFLAAILVPALVSCSGCSSQNASPNENKPNYHRYDQPIIRNVKELTITRSVTQDLYTVGKRGQKISLRLTNQNLDTVKIPEWLRNEKENVKLFLSEKADSPNWVQVWPEQQQQKNETADLKKNLPFMLSPGNSILLDIPVTFLGKVDLKGVNEKKMLVKAELSLKSVHAEPLVFEIGVRAKPPKKVREIIIAD